MDEIKKKFLTLPKVTLGLGLTSAGLLGLLNGETVRAFISEAWREDIIRAMVAFTIAMFITRFVFRKDMERTITGVVTPIVDALNKIADRSEATDIKITDMNSRVVEHSERLLLIEQHLTPRVNNPT